MPSPIAHVAVALAAGVAAPDGSPLRARRALLAAALSSVISDGDLLLVATLPGGILWHHGPTHTLIGAALLGLVVGLAFGLRGVALAWTVICALLHPVLDWELGVPGASPTFGVPILWPLWPDKFVSPYPIFRPFNIHEAGFLANMFTPAAVGPYLREVVFGGVVLAYTALTRGRFRVLRFKRRRPGGPVPPAT